MNLPLPDDASVRRPRVHRSPARLTVCVLLLLGILAEMVMIFLFSNEDKTQSGDRSDKVTEAIALPSAGLCRLCSACCMPPLTKFIRYSRTGARPCWTS